MENLGLNENQIMRKHGVRHSEWVKIAFVAKMYSHITYKRIPYGAPRIYGEL